MSDVENAMVMYIAGVVAWAFLCFAFVAEQVNPFTKPKNYVKRSQWRFGRRIGIVALAFGVGFVLLLHFTLVPPLIALTTCFALFSLSWFLVARYIQANEAF